MKHITDDEARRLARGDAVKDAISLLGHSRGCTECFVRMLRAERGAQIARSGRGMPYVGERCATDPELERHARGKMSDEEMIEFDVHVVECDECTKRLERTIDRLNAENLPEVDGNHEPLDYLE